MKPQFKNRENPVHTSVETGEKIWASRSVAVCVMMIVRTKKDLYVLVTKRGPDVTDSGLWCLPCGFLDFNETLEEAARRELYEETGVLAWEELARYDLTDDPNFERQNITAHYRWSIMDPSGEILRDLRKELVFPSGEVEEGGFKTLSEIQELEFAFNHKPRILD